MTGSGELSVVQLILQATIVVQLVMGLLVLASVYSWTLIFRKQRLLRRAAGEAREFQERFWSGGDLGTLYKSLGSREDLGGTAAIFHGGFREFARLRQQGVTEADALLEGAGRAMKAVQLREVERLEQGLSTLATIGSISPYVGLFGTVWGIMHAFLGLGSVQQATLQTVAPGIAEALIATAIGLAAAIPAVVAYNRFADHVGRIERRYDGFMEEFSTVLQRNASRPSAAAGQSGAAGAGAGD